MSYPYTFLVLLIGLLLTIGNVTLINPQSAHGASGDDQGSGNQVAAGGRGNPSNSTLWRPDFTRLRSPETININTGTINSSTVRPQGDSIDYVMQVRPVMNIRLYDLKQTKPDIEVGACQGDVLTNAHCVAFGNYIFDVIGINDNSNKTGLCTLGSTGGYVDYGGEVCPPDSAIILLSDNSILKVGCTSFGGNRVYTNSNLDAVMNIFFMSNQQEKLFATGKTLSEMTIPRTLKGYSTVNHAGILGNNAVDRYAFALSRSECSKVTSDILKFSSNLTEPDIIYDVPDEPEEPDLPPTPQETPPITNHPESVVAETGLSTGLIAFALLALLAGGGAVVVAKRKYLN